MSEPAQYVYFMRPVGARGPVKIGCSTAPDDRLKLYMSWSPVDLEVAATVPGGYPLEWAFHHRFVHVHARHEWFNADDDLDAVIEAIRAGTFDVDTLPEPKRLRSEAQVRAWSRQSAKVAA